MRCERLDVWRRSTRLSCKIYRHLASCRDYAFRDQITRSGLSVPSNIAEGMERESPKDRRRFLEIARGSAAELITQILIGIEVNYIDSAKGREWKEEVRQLMAMLNSLMSRLR